MNSCKHKLHVQSELINKEKLKPKRMEFINLGQMWNRLSENSADYKIVIQLVNKYAPSEKDVPGSQRTLNNKAVCSTNEDQAEFRNKLREMARLSTLIFILDNHLLALVLTLKDSGRFTLSLGDSDGCDITSEKKKLTSDFYKSEAPGN